MKKARKKEKKAKVIKVDLKKIIKNIPDAEKGNSPSESRIGPCGGCDLRID